MARSIKHVTPSEFGLKMLEVRTHKSGKKQRVGFFSFFQWPAPGVWAPKVKNLQRCHSGYHYWTDWAQVPCHSGELWLVEVSGQRLHGPYKSIAQECRLVKRIGVIGKAKRWAMLPTVLGTDERRRMMVGWFGSKVPKGAGPKLEGV